MEISLTLLRPLSFSPFTFTLYDFFLFRFNLLRLVLTRSNGRSIVSRTPVMGLCLGQGYSVIVGKALQEFQENFLRNSRAYPGVE